MPSRIFLTGGSGFVGTAVVEELRHRGHEIVALTHHGHVPGATAVVRADLFDQPALTNAMAGCTAVIHLIGIIRENPAAGVTFQRLHTDATRAILESTQSAGIPRYLHMSALGTRPNAVSTYHRTKWAAEQSVRATPLDWTILRPSMIHGPRGEFMQMESAWARRRKAPWLFMPYFGRGPLGTAGAGKLQPVHVRDVARAFADALDNPRTIHQTYDLAGPTVLTWPQLHHLTSQAILGRPRPALPIPAWYANLLTRIVPPTLLPFNRDQLIMSQEDNTCDLSKFTHDFGWRPADFESTLKEYAPQL